jgi:hypothetical protein
VRPSAAPLTSSFPDTMAKDSRISITSLLLVLVIFLLLGYQVSKWTAGLFRSPAVEERAVAARGNLAEDEKTTIALFKNASPSVVYITTVAERVDFRTLNVLQVPQGTGSGFVWDHQLPCCRRHRRRACHTLQSQDLSGH